MFDKAIIYYYTAEPMDEYTNRSHKLVRKRIKEVSSRVPKTLVISCTQRSLDFGLNYVVEYRGNSDWMRYWQILEGARIAQRLGIPWVYCCEDETLYTEAHFRWTPPDRERFWYNESHWVLERGIGNPIFCSRYNYIDMCSCVVSTDLLVATLEARFAKFPRPIHDQHDEQLKCWGEPGLYEHCLQLPTVGIDFFATPDEPIITINNKDSNIYKSRYNHISLVKSKLLPGWGSAADVWAEYCGEDEGSRR